MTPNPRRRSRANQDCGVPVVARRHPGGNQARHRGELCPPDGQLLSVRKASHRFPGVQAYARARVLVAVSIGGQAVWLGRPRSSDVAGRPGLLHDQATLTPTRAAVPRPWEQVGMSLSRLLNAYASRSPCIGAPSRVRRTPVSSISRAPCRRRGHAHSRDRTAPGALALRVGGSERRRCVCAVPSEDSIPSRFFPDRVHLGRFQGPAHRSADRLGEPLCSACLPNA